MKTKLNALRRTDKSEQLKIITVLLAVGKTNIRHWDNHETVKGLDCCLDV